MPLSPAALESWVIRSIDPDGSSSKLLSTPGEKPIRLALETAGQTIRVRIYAWNITHGGTSRASDEYRIQITGAYPQEFAGEQVLIVGWSETFNVFAAWDPIVHLNRTSTSPSLQVHTAALIAAYDNGLAAETRGSGDVVIAFQPSLFALYATVASKTHQVNAQQLAADINAIPAALQGPPTSRNMVSQTVETYYRAWDFRKRVFVAYDYRCCACGTQLGLIEAAHIVPVAWPGSTDETRNGLCLCRNHHRAYDAGLITFDSSFVLRVSQHRLSELAVAGRAQGEGELGTLDGKAISLPLAIGDQPHPPYLQEGMLARRWVP